MHPHAEAHGQAVALHGPGEVHQLLGAGHAALQVQLVGAGHPKKDDKGVVVPALDEAAIAAHRPPGAAQELDVAAHHPLGVGPGRQVGQAHHLGHQQGHPLALSHPRAQALRQAQGGRLFGGRRGHRPLIRRGRVAAIGLQTPKISRQPVQVHHAPPSAGAITGHLAHKGRHARGIRPLTRRKEGGPQLLFGLVGAGVAVFWSRREQPHQGGGQPIGNLGALGAGIRHLPRLHPLQLERRVGLLVQAVAHQQLIEHDAGAIEVAAAVQGLPARLLGGHIGVLAAARPPPGVLGPGLAHQPGDAKVKELDLALKAHQHVVGADVPVHQVERSAQPIGGGMGVPQAPHQAGAQVDGQGDGQGPTLAAQAAHQAGEVHPVDIFHGDIGIGAHPSQLVDLHDVGVGQAGRDLGLLDEHGHEAGVSGQARQDALDDQALLEAFGAKAARQEDLGHAAGGEMLDQLVFSESSRQVHPHPGAGGGDPGRPALRTTV